MIASAIGPIHMRAPTEAEAIRLEDRYRAARRKPADGETVDGALYDNGLEEVLACVTSHKVSELHPSDGGLLDDAPALFEQMAAEFRSLGGAGINAEPCAEAVTEDLARSFGKKAVGLSYGGVQLVARKLTWAEYNAFATERDEANLWGLLAKYGKRCVVSHTQEEVAELCGRFPYFSMTIGAKLYHVAQGAVDSSLGKSATA